MASKSKPPHKSEEKSKKIAPKSVQKASGKMAVHKATPQNEEKKFAAAQPEQDSHKDDDKDIETPKLSTAEGDGGNAAAVAAASGNTEMSASFKNFRHHPDMENFYRFIYENDLRLEAMKIFDEIIVQRQNHKLVKSMKTQPH